MQSKEHKHFEEMKEEIITGHKQLDGKDDYTLTTEHIPFNLFALKVVTGRNKSVLTFEPIEDCSRMLRLQTLVLQVHSANLQLYNDDFHNFFQMK